MANLESAMEQMYGDEGLTDELDDDAAQQVLKWGEGRLSAIAQAASDDDAFDASAKQIRTYIKRVNKLVGQRTYLDPAVFQSRMDKLAEQAREMGHPVSDEQVSAFTAQQSGMDAPTAVKALLAWAEPTPEEPTPPDSTSSAAPPTAPDQAEFGDMLDAMRNALDDDSPPSDDPSTLTDKDSQ